MGKASRRAERMGEGANPAENRRARWLNLHCGSLCTVAHFARWLTLHGGSLCAVAHFAWWLNCRDGKGGAVGVILWFSFSVLC